MLKQATVEDIANLRVTKRHGKIVVTTRYYPRFLKRKLVDDYYGALAPSKELLAEFKSKEEEVGDHDLGFQAVEYESKFALSQEGAALLMELSELSKTQDVYVVCHCRLGQRCHRDILLMMAKAFYQAPIGRVYLDYPIIRERIENPEATPLIRA